MKKVFLKPRKEDAIGRRHPWIFSGAIGSQEDGLMDGDLVEVFSYKGQYLATGHWNEGSIMVRIISFEQTPIDQEFWISKISYAYQLRRQLGIVDDPTTNCYRLIHAEGDDLPGLVVDLYAGCAVIQCHSVGMHRQIEEISHAIRTVIGTEITTVFDKSAETLPGRYTEKHANALLFGNLLEHEVLENNSRFIVNWKEGQKTGFFLDQRENRSLLQKYVSGKSVLNAFCYSGGFSVYALKGGARRVHSVDSSAKAIDLALRNVQANEPFPGTHEVFVQDVLKFLNESSQKYEVMIVDPPAFAKHLKQRHNAVQGYKRLNAAAMKKIERGGLLFTFSCSQVVDRQLFQDTIVAAALEAGRQARILHHLSQPPDHPVNLFHPEGAYLKGLVLHIQ